MKRLLIWFTILVSPALIWFAFTDSGRASWRSLISPDARTTSSAVINVEPSPKQDDRSTPRQFPLISAQPGSTEPSLRVQLSDNELSTTPRDKWSLGLVIIDSQGRRSGIDTLKETVYQEIPLSSVERIASRGHPGNQSEAIVVTIKSAISTAYSLEIAGKQEEKYRLAVEGVSPSLESITEISQGSVPADTSIHYQVDLTKIKSLSSPGKHSMGMIVGTAAETERFVSAPEERERAITPSSDPAVLAVAAAITKDPCGYFFQALKTVPHEALTRNDSEYESLLDGKKYLGCEVRFVTNDRLRSGREVPSFDAYEGTELNRLGWRNDNSIAADGPGTSIFGIKNNSVQCLVSSDQPAELNEKTEEITQSETLRFAVQCRKK